MTVRVLVADDQSIVRIGLTTILSEQPGITVVGQAGDGREAVDLARKLRPDVCLMDIRMPILDGVEATRLLAGPDITDPIAVVVITTFDTDQNIYGALRAGARGFLLKGAAPEQLVQAIEAAHRGDALIDPGVTARVLASLAATNTGEPAQPIEPLTPREESVLLEVARGRTNAEIAADLYISMSTVKFHLVSLMTKIDARNRVEGHVGLRDRPTQIAEETLIPTLSRGDQVTADQQHLETAGPGGDTRGDDCAIQCDRPDAGHRLFGQATHRTRRRTHGLQPC